MCYLLLFLLVKICSIHSFTIVSDDDDHIQVIQHIPAKFGPGVNPYSYEGPHELVIPSNNTCGCDIMNEEEVGGKVVLLIRGVCDVGNSTDIFEYNCRFMDKTFHAQQANAKGVIIGNNVGTDEIMVMYGYSDYVPIYIPAVSTSFDAYIHMKKLISNKHENNTVWVYLNNLGEVTDSYYINHRMALWGNIWIAFVFAMFFILGIRIIVLFIISCCKEFNTYRMKMKREKKLNAIPIIKYVPANKSDNDKVNNEISVIEIKLSPRLSPFNEKMNLLSESKNNKCNKGDWNYIHNQECSICLDEFELNEPVKQLPCKHGFHKQCIDEWIHLKPTCPICIQNIFDL